MIPINRRIDALDNLGRKITRLLELFDSDHDNALRSVLVKARIENPWFTEEQSLTALKNWAVALEEDKIKYWISLYGNSIEKHKSPKKIGVVNAGNIPFVGLHDLLSVLLCGNVYIGKNATGDSILLPFIASLISDIEPGFKQYIHFVQKLEQMDAVIATGSNNSSRYFEYYFGKYPHIIRKNRNGVGILNGDETNDQLSALGNDIFTYFGLGCRNVSKLYVPAGYDFNKFFESIYHLNPVMSHSKYMNNFDYNNSVLLLKQIPFLQNGFLIVRKESQIASPVSVLHYEEYENKDILENSLLKNIDLIQCIAANNSNFINNKKLEKLRVEFGKTQSPDLWDYADGVDVVRFLTN